MIPLHKLVCGHLLKAQLQENFPVLGSHLAMGYRGSDANRIERQREREGQADRKDRETDRQRGTDRQKG